MKRSITLISLLSIIPSVWSQHLSPDTILSRIRLQTNVFPQEKLYLQTDKVEYVADETIWVREILILPYTKGGGTEYNASWNHSNLAYIIPLGYQQQVEFYSPSYDIRGKTTQTMDLRSTIYWKPDIQF